MTNRQHESDDEFERELGAQLREQAGGVSDDVGQRLAAARRAAVAQVPETSSFLDRWLVGWSAAAVTTAAAVLAVLLSWPGGNDFRELPLGSEPVIAVVQDMELLEELEFLAWLEEEDAGAG